MTAGRNFTTLAVCAKLYTAQDGRPRMRRRAVDRVAAVKLKLN